MLYAFLQRGPSELHLQHLFLVPLLGFLLNLLLFFLNRIFLLTLQLLPQILYLGPVALKETSIGTTADGFFCSLGMADDIVLGSGRELECIKGLACMVIRRGRTALRADLNGAKDGNERIARECRLQEPSEFAVAIWKMLSIFVHGASVLVLVT